MLFNVVSLWWELYWAGWEKSALARLHKPAFDWANQPGSPGLGPLPRKHSSEGVSPYPRALAERSQYYHCTALTLSPPLSSSLPPPHTLSFPRYGFSFLLLLQLSSSSCALLPLSRPNRLASGDCDLRRNVTLSPTIGCAQLKSVVTVSYYIVYLTEGGGSRTLTIFKSADLERPKGHA